jgi:hypothetical protein
VRNKNIIPLVGKAREGKGQPSTSDKHHDRSTCDWPLSRRRFDLLPWAHPAVSSSHPSLVSPISTETDKQTKQQALLLLSLCLLRSRERLGTSRAWVWFLTYLSLVKLLLLLFGILCDFVSRLYALVVWGIYLHDQPRMWLVGLWRAAFEPSQIMNR